MTEIKNRIESLMQESGMSSNAFSRKAGIDASNFSRKLSGVQNITKLDIFKISRAFGVNEDWLLSGNGEKYASGDKDESKQVVQSADGIPYYDIDFTCSVTEVFNDDPEYPSSYVMIQGVEKADFCCRTSGDSMSPFLMRGDIVAMRKIEDWNSFLPLNEVYGVVTRNGLRAIKVLRKGSSESRLTLHSYNEEYEDQEIDKSVILHIYKVVASARIM